MISSRIFQSVLLTACWVALVHAGSSHQLLGKQTDDPKTPSQQKRQDADATILKSPKTSDPARRKKRDDHSADAPDEGPTYSNPVRTKWKVTARIRGASTPAVDMLIAIPLPVDWPEQSVAEVEDGIPPEITNVKYRELNSRVNQLLVKIPQVGANQEIMISKTFLIATSQINAPPEPSVFKRPKTSHRQGKEYVGVGPLLNFRDSKLRKQVKAITADKEDPWSEVEALYDWVRDNIEDDNEQPRELSKILKHQTGCTEDKVRLFVGMCRAHKIPARVVWVEGTQYAEFMLVDSEKNAYWFPCTVGGIREFGSISEPRIVLQKGDSINVPEKPGRQKFVAEFATCKGKKKPTVKFYRQLLPAD